MSLFVESVLPNHWAVVYIVFKRFSYFFSVESMMTDNLRGLSQKYENLEETLGKHFNIKRSKAVVTDDLSLTH